MDYRTKHTLLYTHSFWYTMSGLSAANHIFECEKYKERKEMNPGVMQIIISFLLGVNLGSSAPWKWEICLHTSTHATTVT